MDVPNDQNLTFIDESQGDRVLVFVFYFTFGLTGIILYGLVFAVLIKHRNLFNSSFYKLIFSLGIAETFGLFYYGFYAAFCTALRTCAIHDALNQVLTTFSWICYYAEFSFHTAISADRILAICFYQHYETIVTRNRLILVISICWLFCFGMSSPFIFNYFTSSYINDKYTDYYSMNTSETHLYDQFQFGCCLFILCICGIMYLITIVTLFLKLGQGKVVKKAEHKLMIQGIVHFVCIFAYLLLFELIADAGTVWVNFASTLMYQSICLTTTILTISMNALFRERLAGIIRSNNRVGSVIVVNQPPV